MFWAGGKASSGADQTPVLSPKCQKKLSTWKKNSWSWGNLGRHQSRIRAQYSPELLRSLWNVAIMWCMFNARCKCASIWNVIPNSCPPFQAEYPRQHQRGPGAANPAVEKSWEGSWKVFAAGAWARPLSSRDKLPGGSWRASSFLSQPLGTKFMEAAAIWLRGLRTAEIRLFVMFLLLLGSRVWARKRSRSMLVVLSKKCQSPRILGVFCLSFCKSK